MPENEKMPAWEVVLNVLIPDGPKKGRPRRMSLHTLGYCIKATDLKALAKEMEASGKVVGYVCPDVQTPIFYLKSLAHMPTMIDTRDERVWGKWGYPTAGAKSLGGFIKKNPYPEIKGFKRFAQGEWSGGKYGVGTYIPAKSGMNKPFEKEDFNYAKLIIKALAEAGYECGITPEDLT